MSAPGFFELRMAWRETRASWKKFLFLFGAVAMGVAAVTGIRGFSTALDHAIARSARDLIAADLSVRFGSAPLEEDRQALESLTRRGAEMTRLTETLSMASPAGSSRPLLSAVKAVDPARYPFYGRVELEPASSLAAVLDDTAAVVSREFLIRTRSTPGDSIRIGEGTFRISAVLLSEPDRILSGFDLGPRILITRNGLERSRLIQFGSRATESFLFRLPSALSLGEARGLLRDALKSRARIADYRDPSPSVTRGLERTANFLSLIGLLALLVGGLGVAMTIHTYLQQKLDGIAVLKCLGGRSGQIIRIYLVQGLLLGAAGCVAGVALGYVIQLLFPRMIRGIIELPTNLEIAPAAALQGFVTGIWTTLLFLAPPLLAIRKVRPIRVFLREMPETRLSTLARLRRDPLPLLVSVGLAAGVVLMAVWLADSWTRGTGFVAGLVASILILWAGAALLLAGLKRLPRPSSLVLRHGLRNLSRPGSHVSSVLVALGIGVGFILTVFLIQNTLIPQIARSAPPDFPNLFLLGITERDRPGVWELLGTQAGVLDTGTPIPAVPSRLRRINGTAIEEMPFDSSQMRHARIEFVLTWAEMLPPETTIVEGAWWPPGAEMSQISVGRHTARELGISVGDTLEFESSGLPVRGRVASIRDVEFARPGSNNQFIFSPGALDSLPASYVGGIRVEPSRMASLQGALFDRFPSVTSIDVTQVFLRVQTVIDRVADIVRFVAGFAIAAGLIILASSVVSTRYQRIREAVILKTLGARKSQIVLIQSTEFLIIGAAAGLIGCLLASLAADVLLGRLLETEYDFQWLPVAAGTASSAAVSVITGWLASRGVLNQRPLEVLREN